MANPSMRRGSEFERRVATYLARWFEWADRKVKTGARDTGDITGVRDWTIEVKATAALDLATAVREAKVEAANADTRWWVAILRAKGKPVEKAYAVMDLEEWAALVRYIEALQRAALVAGR